MAVSLGVAALLLVACGQSNDGSGTEPAQDGGLFDERIGAEIEDATANGASADQLALLERARGEGEVTIETARQARRAYAECATAAGVEVTFDEVQGLTIKVAHWGLETLVRAMATERAVGFSIGSAG